MNNCLVEYPEGLLVKNCLCISSTGSVVYERLCEALTNNALVKGIKQASPLSQTSCLEGFHSVLNHFAPKMIAFSYAGMYCRYRQILVCIYKVIFLV